jgi:DNA repair exonuclease SbcCD ATPase subunit
VRTELHLTTDVTVILAPNESGKTTLVEAVLTALYGPPETVPPSEWRRPWSGPPHGVALEVDLGGRRVLIERDLERGTVHVRDAATRTELPGGLRNADGGVSAESALHLTRAECESVVMGSAGESFAEPFVSVARLEHLVFPEGDKRDLSHAIALVERERAAAQIGEELFAAYENELRTLDAERAALEEYYASINAKTEPLGRVLEEEQAAAREAAWWGLCGALAEARELRAQLAARAARDAARKERAAERETLRAAGTAPPALWERAMRLDDHLAALEAGRAAEDAEVRSLTARTRELERELGSSVKLASLTAEDAERAEDAASALEKAGDDLTSATARRSAEEDAVRREGRDPTWFRRLAARMESLSEAQHGLLAHYTESTERLRTALQVDRDALVEATARHEAAVRRTRGERRALVSLAGVGAVAGLAGGAALVVGGVPTDLVPATVLPALAGGGGTLCVGSLAAVAMRARLRLRTVRDLAEQEAKLKGSMRTKASGIVRLETQLDELTRTLGAQSPEQLLADAAVVREVIDRLDPYDRAVEEARARQREAMRIIEALLAKASRANVSDGATIASDAPGTHTADDSPGVPEERREHLVRDARTLARDVRARLDLDAQFRSLTVEKSRHKARLAELLVEGGAAVEEMEALAREVGVAPSVADLRGALRASVERGQRLAALDEMDRRDTPPADEQPVETVEARLLELDERALSLQETVARPFDAGTLTEPSWAYAARAKEAEQESTMRASLRERLVEDATRAAEIYATEVPRLTRTRREVAERLARARRAHEVFQLARAALEATAAEAHREWAEPLEVAATRFLEAVWGDGRITFGADLLPELIRDDRRLSARDLDTALSIGAREQIRLAVRIALAQFLSRGGEVLPLVLDEPLAASDRTRTRSAMRFLAEEIAPRHQVVLLTAHAAHADMLQQASAVSGATVCVLDLGTLHRVA